MATKGSRGRKAEPATLEFVDDLEFWLTRKRVKNINVHVKSPSGRIEVSAPLHVLLATIKGFLREKHDWLVHAQKQAWMSPANHAENATEAEKREWREVIEACVPALVAEWEPIIGVKAGKLAYRNMRSRWGSCQPSTGRICINTRLALYPPECIEYVVVHELCHLRERGHGPRFHALMDHYMPDWKARRKKLQ